MYMYVCMHACEDSIIDDDRSHYSSELNMSPNQDMISLS